MSGGLSARQVRGLQNVSPEEWNRERKGYADWRRRMQGFPIPLLFVVGGGAGCLAYWLWPRKGLLWGVVGWCLVMTAFYALRSLSVREKHWEIYSAGYESGHTAGVNKVLGVTEKDEELIDEIIRDQEIDEIMNRKDEQPSS